MKAICVPQRNAFSQVPLTWSTGPAMIGGMRTRGIPVRLTVFLALWMTSIAAVAGTFDGRRTGPVLTGQFGFSPLTARRTATRESIKTGSVLDLMVGWGVSSRIVVGGQVNLLAYEVSADNMSHQGFAGPVAQYLFRPDGLSPMVGLGVGIYGSRLGTQTSYETGPGVLVLTALELTRHWRVGASAAFGQTDSIMHLQLSGMVGLTFY